jgi:DNA repair protein RadD
VRFEGQPCPVCHWRPVARAIPVDFVDGELGLVARDRSVVMLSPSFTDQRDFYAQLLWIASERGYQPGWAAHKFKEKIGDWPPPTMRRTSAVPPTAAVRSWVRSRQIAFAKAKAKERPAA